MRADHARADADLTATLAAVLSRHFETYDLMLHFLRDRASASPLPTRNDFPIIDRDSGLAGFAVTDARGTLVSSTLPMADSRIFADCITLWRTQDALDQLVCGSPTMAIILFGRSNAAPSEGLTWVLVRIRHLEQTLGDFMPGRDRTIAILDQRGQLLLQAGLARTVPQGFPWAAIAGAAAANGAGVVTAGDHVVDFHRVTAAPLIVTMTSLTRERDGIWWRHALRIGAITLAIDIFGVALVLLAQREITRRRRAEQNAVASEQRLLLTIESIADHALFGVDALGTIVTWNQGGHRLFGYTSSRIGGCQLDVLCHKPPTGWASQALAMSLAFGRFDDHKPLCRADGSVFEAAITISALTGSGRHHLGHVVVIRDITQQLEAETRIRRMERLDAIGHVTASVAHDFNNLLQTQIIGLQMLQDALEPGSEAREFADLTLHAADQAAALTTQLLAITRQQALELTPVEPASALRNVMAFARLSKNVVRVAFGDDGSKIPPVMADRAHLETALLNLVVNATDAVTNTGQVTLGVCLPPLDWSRPPGVGEDQSMIVFWVADNGHGMPPDVLAKAGQPFFTTKGSKGTGLGLSMVQAFARQSGGDTIIHSTVGIGTRIEIWLPVVTPGTAAGGVSTIATGIGGRIVLLDRSAAVLSVLVAFLTGAGFDVAPAETSAAASAALSDARRADVLIADVIAPDAASVALVWEAYRLRPPIPVIVITNGPDVPGLPPGTLVLRKPFRKEALLRHIAGILSPAT